MQSGSEVIIQCTYQLKTLTVATLLHNNVQKYNFLFIFLCIFTYATRVFL